MNEHVIEPPWYRQFWPWFVIALPASSVVAGLVTLYLAGAAPAMVVDDYGRIAMVTAQRAERSQRAEELGMAAELSFSDGQSVNIRLARRADLGAWPDTLYLQLIHPTRAERDVTLQLSGIRNNYSANLARPEGRYYVSLHDEEGVWRLTGELSSKRDSLALNAGDGPR